VYILQQNALRGAEQMALLDAMPRLLYAAQFCVKSSAAEQTASLVAMQQLMSALCCAVLL